MSRTASLETPEERAAWLLFARTRGGTSVARMAAAAQVPFEEVELLLCRGLSTLVARGYPVDWLCENYTLTPEQLRRAAMAAPFGESFRAIGEGKQRPQRWT